MGLGCFGKEIRQDRVYTSTEERQTEGLVLLLRQMNTCGASYWSESADRALEAERKWTVSMWDFLYIGKFWEMPGTSTAKKADG